MNTTQTNKSNKSSKSNKKREQEPIAQSKASSGTKTGAGRRNRKEAKQASGNVGNTEKSARLDKNGKKDSMVRVDGGKLENPSGSEISRQNDKRIQHGEDGKLLKGNTLSEPYWFKPGVAQNPGGRPKKSVLDDAIEKFLESEIKDYTRKYKRGQLVRKDCAANILVRALFKQAIAGVGKGRIAQLLAERVGGKPLQSLDIKAEKVESDPEARRNRIKELELRLKERLG